jgi:hypothetical protein
MIAVEIETAVGPVGRHEDVEINGFFSGVDVHPTRSRLCRGEHGNGRRAKGDGSRDDESLVKHSLYFMT